LSEGCNDEGRNEEPRNLHFLRRVFCIHLLGPYHGWKYGLVFSVGLTVSLWLIMRFVRVPLGEPSQGEPSHSEPTATASHIAEAAAIRRRD
jgi:hypothetical protein